MSADDLIALDAEEAGEEPEELKARDPSFFHIPWDAPEADLQRDEQVTLLTVATNELLTEPQRIHIRTDATVRLNRIWKGRFDRFNGKYFIESLKNAHVFLPPSGKIKDKNKWKLLLEMEGEREGLETDSKGREEGSEEQLAEQEEVGEEGETDDGFGTKSRDPVSLILDILKEAQKNHDEMWKTQAMEKLSKEFEKRKKLLTDGTD